MKFYGSCADEASDNGSWTIRPLAELRGLREREGKQGAGPRKRSRGQRSEGWEVTWFRQ